MKCPVCRNELPANPKRCDICGFEKLRVEFFSVDGATAWVEDVVLPYREEWKKRNQCTEQQKRSDDCFRQRDNAFVDPSDFEYTFDERGVVVTRYLKYGFKSTVHIPETIKGRNVYRLGTDLFKDCKELELVYVPSTVQVLGDNSFRNTSIKAIHLPPYLSVIGSFAFCGSELQEIDLPYCVSFIGEGAFKDTYITNISFPERIKKIPRGVCSNCYTLKSATILGAEDLSAYAFSSCQNLEELILPETLVSISDDRENRTANTSLRSYSSLKLKDCATLVLPKSLESFYIGSVMPAKTIVAKNSNMKWNGVSDSNGFKSSGFDLGDLDLGDVFNSFFHGKKEINCTIYCLPGSTSHELAREKGYNVKHLSDFK